MSIAHIVEESPPRKLYRWANQRGSGLTEKPVGGYRYARLMISHSEEAYAQAYGLPGEPPWKRAFRRHPIKSHKPGP
jgi:hypothetical protein